MKKVTPVDSDYITDIAYFKQVFLKYLKRGKLEKQSYEDFFAQAFRLDERTITTMKCTSDVKLRGSLWVDSVPIEGLIARRVLNMRKGQIAWVRDDKDEKYITLENKFGCVQIDRSEWYATYFKHFST